MHGTIGAPTVPLPVATPDDMAYYERNKPDTGVRLRILIERAIVRKTVEALLAAGYQVAVHDGEETACKRTASLQKVMKAIMATDDDLLTVSQNPGAEGRWEEIGWIKFVYGNSGWDVTSDHTMNLGEVLKPVEEYADALARWC